MYKEFRNPTSRVTGEHSSFELYTPYIEQVSGIEPLSQAWKASIITVILHLLICLQFVRELNPLRRPWQGGILTVWPTNYIAPSWDSRWLNIPGFPFWKPCGSYSLKKSHYEGGAVIGTLNPKNRHSAVRIERIHCSSLGLKTLSTSYSSWTEWESNPPLSPCKGETPSLGTCQPNYLVAGMGIEPI